MEQKNLLSLLDEAILEYRTNSQWGTAHVYRSARNSFAIYNKGVDLPLSELTPARLKDYEAWLRNHSSSWNTVATYMKTLKAVYNRAVDRGEAPFVPRLFKCVRTSPVVERKRALKPSEMSELLQSATRHEQPETEEPPMLRSARQLFDLMFLLRGIPFVDLAYLRRSDIRDGVLYYRRRKTGRLLAVRLTPEAIYLIDRLQNPNSRNRSGYLLPFLSHAESTLEAYREYQAALRRFNRLLKLLPGQPSPPGLSSYCARHTWATMAYHCEVSPGVISEAMGHSSIAVTEIYLKPFRDERIDRANRQVIDYVLGTASAEDD